MESRSCSLKVLRSWASAARLLQLILAASASHARRAVARVPLPSPGDAQLRASNPRRLTQGNGGCPGIPGKLSSRLAVWRLARALESRQGAGWLRGGVGLLSTSPLLLSRLRSPVASFQRVLLKPPLKGSPPKGPGSFPLPRASPQFPSESLPSCRAESSARAWAPAFATNQDF